MRGLERPREDIDGRFLRAIRIARESRLPKLELSAVYDWAWTSFFWFDDPATLTDRYDAVEKLALGSDAAEDLERLSNLIALLRNSVAAGALTDDEARLDARAASLAAALSEFRDSSRPNNSLHAHALLLLSRLAERAYWPAMEEDFSALWDEFRQVIEQSDGLGTFPFESIVLGKYDLAVRDAWEIGPNDPDVVVLDPNNPPTIPPGQANAPALKAIERLRHLEHAR